MKRKWCGSHGQQSTTDGEMVSRMNSFNKNQDWQCKYKRNIEARLCKHCCSGGAISITYCECVCVALVIQHCNAHAPYCHPWPAPFYNIFSHYLKNSMNLKKKVTEHKMCVLTSSTIFVWNISHSKEKWARYDQNCILVFMYRIRYSCWVLMKLLSQIKGNLITDCCF